MFNVELSIGVAEFSSKARRGERVAAMINEREIPFFSLAFSRGASSSIDGF